MCDVTFLVKGYTSRLVFVGDLQIAKLTRVKATLVGLLNVLPAGMIELDLSEVHEFDGAGAQMLFSFIRSLKAKGASVHLRGCSDEVGALACVLGQASPDDCLGASYVEAEELQS